MPACDDTALDAAMGKVYVEVQCRHCGKRWKEGTPWKPCPECGSGNVKVLKSEGEIRRMKCWDCGATFKLVEEVAPEGRD